MAASAGELESHPPRPRELHRGQTATVPRETQVAVDPGGNPRKGDPVGSLLQGAPIRESRIWAPWAPEDDPEGAATIGEWAVLGPSCLLSVSSPEGPLSSLRVGEWEIFSMEFH